MTIFASNLNCMTTVGHLTSLFARFGKVNSIRIIRDRNTGQSTGIAMIDMDHKPAMIAMAELNNLNFMNRYLKLEQE
ncbi:MAG: RNA-binding protein [Chitinophagaceae bacterium]